MAESPPSKPIEVSPEEERFLRRFVRRETLPWLAGVSALAALALGAALHQPLAPNATSSLAPAPGALPAVSDPDEGPLVALREENERLRADLGTLAREVAELKSVARAGAVGGANVDVHELELRVREVFETRVARLESSLAALPASADAGDGAPVQDADLVAIRDRVFNLEMRQDRKDQERAALQQELLARLDELERAHAQLEHSRAPGSVPAAPAD